MRPFDSGHEDLVHDVAYDFYGRHLATCSSDQHVKIFRLDKDLNEWILSDSWKAHDSSIVSVDWANPEFGRLIVTASYDKTIKIWEEDPDQEECSGRRWTRLCTLNDSKGSIYSVKFAPSHLGLRMASIGNDGVLRIYDSLEPADLRVWSLTTTVKVLSVPPASHLQSDFCLSWCPSKFQNEQIAVCVLDQALIYQRNTNDDKLHVVGKLSGHSGLIRSVSWAPSIGRDYQLIATGCKDGKVRIYKLTEKDKLLQDSNSKQTTREATPTSHTSDSTTPAQSQSQPPVASNLKIELISEHGDHNGEEVWSVSWNLTGTILSSAGGDGKVRLWKSTYSNEFRCMSIITAQQN